MRQVGRILEVVLGVLFVAAAVLKALDMSAFTVQVSLYGVLSDLTLIRLAAWGSLCAETALGVALIAGIRLRGLTVALTFLMLAGFSVLIAYAWKYHGLADCGCFGKYAPMSPGASIGKNIAMMAMAVIAGFGARRDALEKAPVHWFMNPAANGKLVVSALSVVAVAGATLLSPANALPSDGRTTKPRQTAGSNPADAPFAQFKFQAEGVSYDLGHGDHFVALLSATCNHCIGTVPAMNELMLMPDLPPIVAIMLGDQAELTKFRATTNPVFPTVLTQDASQFHLEPAEAALAFMKFIDGAPPRFFLVRDGKGIKDWKDTPPAAEAIQEAAQGLAGEPTKPAT